MQQTLELLSIEDAAELLAVDADVVLLWTTEGTGGFPAAINMNGIPRFRADELAAWLDRQPLIGGADTDEDTITGEAS